MFSVFTRFKGLFVVFIVFVQFQTCFLQSHWKSQKRSAEANASEVPKNKAAASILTHQLQRRLLPKTEMQQKAQNASLNTKKTNRINDVDEIGGNEINRVSDLNNFIDDLPISDGAARQGECTNCGADDSSSSSKCTMTLPLLKSGEKRYYIGTFFKANWYRAAQYCRYHGMQLASISNQEENDKLEKYVTDYGFGFEHFWTSGTDLAEEGSFFWMASGKPFVFTNWNSGEPNNFKYENGEEEHCMELWNRDGKGLKWNDSPCSFETYFICEM